MIRPLLIAAGGATTLLVALLMAELWARWTYGTALPAPIQPNEVELPAELVEPDLVLGRRFRANASKLIESAHGEFVALYQINDIHLRGYGLVDPGSRPPYVIVLGDSFVEGWGVMSDSIFVKEIERRLRKMEDMHYRTRLFNAGMTGYGAAQSYLLGRQLIESLDPDVVVFVYTSLMPVADHRFLAGAEIDAEGLALRAASANESPASTAQETRFILDRSTLFKVLRIKWEARTAREAVEPGDPKTDLFAATRGTRETIARLHQHSLKHVAALAAMAKARGLPFIFIHIPLPHQVSTDEWANGRAAYRFEARDYAAPDIEVVEAFCTRLELDCIMAAPLLRKLAERSSSPVYFRYDHTLTTIGHHALADHLLNKIAAALRKTREN